MPYGDSVRSKHKARAKRAGVPGSFEALDVRAKMIQQGACCYYCKSPFPLGRRNAFQIDHKTPLSRGGSNYASNIVLACVTCNQRKGSKTADEFMAVRHD